MATEGEYKLLARVTALEYLMRHVLLMAANSGAEPEAAISAYHGRIKDALASATMPAARDAARSDLMIQYLEEAVDALFVGLREEARSPAKPR